MTSSQQCRRDRCRKDRKEKRTIAWLQSRDLRETLLLSYLHCRPRDQVRILILSAWRDPMDVVNVHMSSPWRDLAKGNEHMGMGKTSAPNRGGSDTARDLALNNISDSRNNFDFKGKVVRNSRHNFMVPENVQFDFSVNEAIWEYLHVGCRTPASASGSNSCSPEHEYSAHIWRRFSATRLRR